MAILLRKQSAVVIFGEALFLHQMKVYGTRCMAIIGANSQESLPVFSSAKELTKKVPIDIAVIASSPECAPDHIMEAADAKIPLVICCVDGIARLDYIEVVNQLKHTGTMCIGPSSFGIITPGVSKIGGMPNFVFCPPKRYGVGIISTSAIVTYEIAWELTQNGIGQTTCVGVGDGNRAELIRLFDQDHQTAVIVVIDTNEHDQWRSIRTNKPIVAYLPGHSLMKKAASSNPSITYAQCIEEIPVLVRKLSKEPLQK